MIRKTNQPEGKIPKEDIEALKQRLRGELLLPEDAGYDEARTIWNAMFDKKPAMIVQCLGTSDVVLGVNFAREHNLLIAVKGGGHNVAGNAICEGGMVLDLSGMRSVYVEAAEKTVRADAGCLLSDLDIETQLYGLAVPGGIVSHTGIGGLTLGGGFGWISRKFGLTIDSLLSVRMVTANGQVITASADENAELFWGIRGGGGNFGVVTSFKFKCAQVGPKVFSGIIVQRFEDIRRFMQFHSEYVRTLPDDMTVWMVIRHAPPLPFLDSEIHGKLVVLVPFLYLGSQREGEKLIQPILDFGQPHASVMGMNSWVAWQSSFDGLNAHGARNYWKSHHLKALSSACIDKIIEFAGQIPSGSSEIFIPHMEGAPSRVPADETAYSFRTNPFVLNIHTRWEDQEQDEKCISWARNFFDQTKQFAHGVYVNFLSDEGQSRVREAYSDIVWRRLVALKNQYDPDNLFKMNQNIPPTAN